MMNGFKERNYLKMGEKFIAIAAAALLPASTPALSQAQYVPSTCKHGYYQNAEGVCVHKPTRVPYEGATALCRDGLYCQFFGFKPPSLDGKRL
jgi:hypothetical protein